MTINWSWSSTGVEVADEYGENISGRTFLITGPSDGGIGAETALCLASGQPSTIVLAGRDRAKIQPVIDRISLISPRTNAIFVALDLSDQASVRDAATEISKQVDHIDVLINNAAIMACPYSTTKDNLEVQFATNFLGPFLFTGLLFPKLRAAGAGARIVNVSSSAHRFEGIRFDDIDFKVCSGDNRSPCEFC
jgi:NAD(P)-dependent dehydrogenase (short-subunit alcohol dehydrogenase family)